MLKKLILPAICALSFFLVFATNASALTAQGKFKMKSYKIKGAWALLEIEGQQVISFHSNFKTKDGPDLKLFLSKQTLRNLDKNPTFIEPLSLGPIRSHTGDQNYVLPAHIHLEDYSSLVIHCEKFNVLWGGFDIPKKSLTSKTRDDEWGEENELGEIFDESENTNYGS